MNYALEIWFAFGVFSALMQYLESYYEGENLLQGWILLNAVVMLIFGPITLMIQFAIGKPIIPRKDPVSREQRLADLRKAAAANREWDKK